MASLAPTIRPKANARLVVYTVLIGSKEPLGNPLDILPANATTDLELSFICFTDDVAMQSPVWTMRSIGMAHLPPEKLSRRPKATPHSYFPDEEFSLYVDNIVKFKRLPQSSDLPLPPGPPMMGFRHATRSNPRDEAMAVAMLGYDDTATLVRQMDFYKSKGPLEDLTPLTTGTVLMRRHHAQAVREFGTIWWENILAFSKRDQLSMAYAMRAAQLDVGHYPGITRDNEFVHWAGSLSPDRVRANFDDKRYAWVHRNDPSAQKNPRKHFLDSGAVDHNRYEKPGDLLEYLCYDHACSLGAHILPRRRVAASLEVALKPFRREDVHFLLVRLNGFTGPTSFESDELDSAVRVISTFLSPAKGTVFELGHADIEQGTTVFRKMDTEFNLLIVIGLAGEMAANVVERFKRVMSKDSGRIVLIAATDVSYTAAAVAERAVISEFETAPTTWLAESSHEATPVDREPTRGLCVINWRKNTGEAFK